MYYEGMLRNAELALTVYPGWEVWCYVGPEVSVEYRNKLIARGGKVIDAATEFAKLFLARRINHTGMFWRFMPPRNSKVECMISRDADSRLNVREKAAVDAWLASDKKYHVMRDHPNHKRRVMLGGMWGVKGHFDVLHHLQGVKLSGRKGEDQEFLRARIWTNARQSCLEHGFYGQPFPAHPPYKGFVGQRYTEADVGWSN